MRKWVPRFAPIVLGALLMAPGAADAIPLGWFQVGDGPIHYIEGWNAFSGGEAYMAEFHVETSEYEISGTVLADWDPFISYGISVQNFTVSPANFTFHFETPIMPVAGPNTVYGSFAASLTDVTGNGVWIDPTAPDVDGDGVAEIAVSDVNGTNLGVDVGRYWSTGPGVPGASYVAGPWQAGPQSGPVGGSPWDLLAVDVEFQLSPFFDIATVNGFTSIDVAPIPEPSALLLLGGGLLGIALWRRKRS